MVALELRKSFSMAVDPWSGANQEGKKGPILARKTIVILTGPKGYLFLLHRNSAPFPQKHRVLAAVPLTAVPPLLGSLHLSLGRELSEQNGILLSYVAFGFFIVIKLVEAELMNMSM